jgi:hypothetical protein
MSEQDQPTTIITIGGEPGNRSLEELHNRRTLAQLFIKILDHEVDHDDPRWPAAMELHKESLAKIDAEIAAITGKPPDIVIGLQPGRLVGTPWAVGQPEPPHEGTDQTQGDSNG